ncbi:hypothetical protein [Arthrobacter zhaoguopingii]|uniref:hypothetical protein n=1 Tax=Arthrobacter zhaoguopingii TaxID=2681491 RepID=UPI001356ABC5|nr:hypothetical protein [Arthrobacter zhaoguopingii]
MPQGRSDEQWERMMEAGRYIMIRTAKRGSLIPYGEFNKALAEDAEVAPFDLSRDGERNALGALLADIVKDDPDHKKYMLSSVVALATLDAPGKGFYSLAEHLEHLEAGANATRKHDVWVKQAELTHEHYRRTPRT